MSETAISVRELSCAVGQKLLLQGLSFSVERGKRVAIIGPNGAGKTSLLRALLGFLKPSSGEIEISGVKHLSLSRKNMAQAIAYVPQLLNSEVAFTVREFVGMGRYAHGGSMQDVAVDKALLAVSMEGFDERIVATLSGGERQRVCIAAALAQESPILVLDEPLAHLDPKQRLEVQSVLHNLDSTITQLVVTHDLGWVEKGFDQVLAIDGGRVVFDGDVETYLREGVSERLFGVASCGAGGAS